MWQIPDRLGMEMNFFQMKGFNHPNCCKTFGMVHGTAISNHFCACSVYLFWNKWRDSVCSQESSTVSPDSDVMPSSVVRSCLWLHWFGVQECIWLPVTINTRAFFHKRYCFLTDYFSGLMQKSSDRICWFCWFQAKHGNITNISEQLPIYSCILKK